MELHCWEPPLKVSTLVNLLSCIMKLPASRNLLRYKVLWAYLQIFSEKSIRLSALILQLNHSHWLKSSASREPLNTREGGNFRWNFTIWDNHPHLLLSHKSSFTLGVESCKQNSSEYGRIKINHYWQTLKESIGKINSHSWNFPFVRRSILHAEFSFTQRMDRANRLGLLKRGNSTLYGSVPFSHRII